MAKVSNVEIPIPTPYTFVWTPSSRAAVLAGIRAKQISFKDAVTLFRVSEDQIRQWQRAYEIEGIDGLRD